MSYLQEAPCAQKTISQLQTMRNQGEKIAVLTAYDASFSALMSQVGVDALLVGDSLGNVIQGHESTTPVTMSDMVYHTMCVARGNRSAFLMADMPFGSYSSPDQAMKNAVLLMQAGAQMVKLEGGQWVADTIRFLVERGVPVCAHLGLMPQSVHMMGGFKVQGKTPEAARQLLADAKCLETAGAQMLLLEAIPSSLGKLVTDHLQIPTIGIGAGPDCSGQVLVMHDMLGAFPGRTPKFVKNFLLESGSIAKAIEAYVAQVKAKTFPGPEHGFKD